MQTWAELGPDDGCIEEQMEKSGIYRWTKEGCTDGQEREVQMDGRGIYKKKKDEKCKHRQRLAQITAL